MTAAQSRILSSTLSKSVQPASQKGKTMLTIVILKRMFCLKRKYAPKKSVTFQNAVSPHMGQRMRVTVLHHIESRVRHWIYCTIIFPYVVISNETYHLL